MYSKEFAFSADTTHILSLFLSLNNFCYYLPLVIYFQLTYGVLIFTDLLCSQGGRTARGWALKNGFTEVAELLLPPLAAVNEVISRVCLLMVDSIC